MRKFHMKWICCIFFIFFTVSLSESAGIVKNQQMMQQKKMQQQQAIIQQQQGQAIAQAQKQNIQKQTEQQMIAQTQEIVDFANIWEKLKISSHIWVEIMDDKPKVMIVEDYIAAFAGQGIVIAKDPQFYVKMIDNLAIQNPQMLNSPFADVLRFVAIIEYDYDNGQDRDALAKKVLGPQAFEKNRQRFGLPNDK